MPWSAFPAYLYSSGRLGIMAQAQLDDTEDLREQADRYRSVQDAGLEAQRPLHRGEEPRLLAEGQGRRPAALPRLDHLQADRRERADGQRHPGGQSRPRARRRCHRHRAVPHLREERSDQFDGVDQVPGAQLHAVQRHDAAVRQHQRAVGSRVRGRPRAAEQASQQGHPRAGQWSVRTGRHGIPEGHRPARVRPGQGEGLRRQVHGRDGPSRSSSPTSRPVPTPRA